MSELDKQFDLLVIIPVYNKGEKVKVAIESCLQQSYKNFHICVIDDCSTDNSFESISNYQNYDNITIIRNKENRGCYYCRNIVLQLFKDYPWNFFTVHDADDSSTTERFKIVLDKFNENQNCISVLTPYVRVNKNKKGIIKKGDGIAFFRREVFENIGYFDDTRFAGDTEYLQRLNKYLELNDGGEICELDIITYFAFDDKNNLTNIYKKNVRKKYMDKKMLDLSKMYENNNFYKIFFN